MSAVKSTQTQVNMTHSQRFQETPLSSSPDGFPTDSGEPATMEIVAIDLGSSKIKACHFGLGESQPKLLASWSRDCPLKRPSAGCAEHDLEAQERCLRELLEEIPARLPLSFSSAMHSLVVLDENRAPVGPALSWSDTRSATQAQELRKSEPGLHSRSGTPLHPMAWPSKILWWQQREEWTRCRHLTDVKSYLLERLLGEPVPMDLSNASGTGLLSGDDWDEWAGRIGIRPEQLPELRSPRHSLQGFGRTLFLGGADGPLASLGSGPGLAISVGTSAAVRETVRGRPAHQPELFCYRIVDDLWVRGGALSNGTSVLDWLQKLSGRTLPEVIDAAFSVESEGLVCHPYLSGERAPFWEGNRLGGIQKLGFHHQFPHLARAFMEGVAFSIHRLIQLCSSRRDLRCSGGLFQEPRWSQLLADVTARTVEVPKMTELSALGAALLGSQMTPELEVRRYEPQRSFQGAYQEWLRLEPEV